MKKSAIGPENTLISRYASGALESQAVNTATYTVHFQFQNNALSNTIPIQYPGVVCYLGML